MHGDEDMKIRLTGDHSAYHCGSAAAFEAISAEAARHGQIVDGEEYDLLVVNGEGSMHHDSEGCRRKMAEIGAALNAGRRVMLVNTVWQDNPKQYAELLTQCDQVVAREICSARELAEAGVQAEVKIDQSFFRRIDEVDDPVDFGGAVLVTDFFSREFETFAKITGAWAKKFTYLDLRDWAWSKLVRSLPTASLLVTGRHHAVYAACRARLPFLALEGNTHKISGLIQTAGSDIPIFESFADLKVSMTWPNDHLRAYGKLFDWMDQQSPWRLELPGR